MPTTLTIENFTIQILTERPGPTESLMLELSHPQSDRIAVAQLSANLNGPTYERTPDKPCNNCCSDCANRAAVATARTIG